MQGVECRQDADDRRNPTVSIVVPVYNASRFIVECAESVLGQSFSDLELILVDDGSTDDSLVKCRALAEKDGRVRVFSQANGGPSAARNFGISQGRGKYVQFVDADDTLSPDCCEKAVRRMADADIVFWGFTKKYPHGTEELNVSDDIACAESEAVQKELLKLKQTGVFGFTWDKMFRADIIKENGLEFVKGLTLVEDEVFTDMYCKHAKTLSVIGESLYDYKVLSGGNLTFRKQPFEVYYKLSQLFGEFSEQYSYAELVEFERLLSVDYLLQAAERSETLGVKYRLFAEAGDEFRSRKLKSTNVRLSLLKLWRPIGFVLFLVSGPIYAYRLKKAIEKISSK